MKKLADSIFRIHCISLIVISYCFVITSCTHDVVDLELLDTVCFQSQILPLLKTSCGTSGCHDSIARTEGFAVTDYASIMQLVTGGDPRASKLYKVITDINGENLMPPDNPLSKYNRNLIQVWIAQGALNTQCNSDTGINWADTICFKQDILPIFTSNCGVSLCHDATTHAEGYTLTSYTTIMNSGGIVAYNPGNSQIYKAITANNDRDLMPPDQALPSEQINKIRIWIEQGAVESDCPERACDTSGTISFSTQVFPVFQTNCVSCHSTAPGSGNILLNNYDNVVSSSAVMRNDTRVLIGSLRHLDGFAPMPPGSNQIDECSIRMIEIWIDQGTADN